MAKTPWFLSAGLVPVWKIPLWAVQGACTSVCSCPSVQAEQEHNKLRSQSAVDDGQPVPSSFQRCGQQSSQLLAFNFWPLMLSGPNFSHVPVASLSLSAMPF